MLIAVRSSFARSTRLSRLAPLIALAALAPAAAAQLEIASVPDAVAVTGDEFGSGVDIDGDRLVIGAPHDQASGQSEGAVYTFLRDRAGTPDDPSDDGWVFEAKLIGPAKEDTWSPPEFGSDVSLDGDRLLVGAPRAHTAVSDFPGAAYVFQFDGASWVLEDALEAADGENGDEFGREVSLSGNHALIGAHADDDLADRSGAAYVFHRAGGSWAFQAKLHGDTDVDEDAFFGWSVALDGDRALVGAVNETSAAGSQAGAVYAFLRDDGGTHSPADDTWIPAGRLQPAGAIQSQFFGTALALDGARALIGASGDSELGSGIGAAYVYEEASGLWNEGTKLLPALPFDAELAFGTSVALRGDTALVTSHAYDPLQLASDGKLHVFRLARGEWTAAGTASPSDGLISGSPMLFGDELQVAFDGEIAALGPRSSLPFALLKASMAWTYAIEQAPWSWASHELAAVGADSAPVLFGAGSLLAGEPVSLSVHGGAASAPAFLFVGGTAVNAPFHGGVLVPSPDRLTLLPLDTEGSVSIAGTWPAGIATGLTLHLQAWIPDAAGPAGFTATNALAFTTP